MDIVIFSNISNNRSIDRYVDELMSASVPGATIRSVNLNRRPGFTGTVVDQYLRYLSIARKETGDVNVIASEGYSHLLWSIAKGYRAIVCHDVHPLHAPVPERLVNRVYFMISRVLYMLKLRWMWRADKIFAVSEYTKSELHRLFPARDMEKVVVVHNGIHGRWRPIEDAEAKRSFAVRHGLEGYSVVLHVGGSVWYKNFPALIDGFAASGINNKRLVKVGSLSNDDKARLEKAGVAEHVVQLTDLSDDDMVMLYNVADVLVFPSLSEGFGWPPLEAMACGCPVVLSRRASLPEVGGDACLYVDPDDPRAIADAIDQLLLDPSLAGRLKREGIIQASQFSWQDTLTTMLRTLDTDFAYLSSH